MIYIIFLFLMIMSSVGLPSRLAAASRNREIAKNGPGLIMPRYFTFLNIFRGGETLIGLGKIF